jgi:hypothetical protein
MRWSSARTRQEYAQSTVRRTLDTRSPAQWRTRHRGCGCGSPGDPGGVLLVDGVVAGLSGVRLAAERARAVGAERVEALILGALLEKASLERDSSVAEVITLGRERPMAA